ncbi:hypothetical protein [Catenulispora rubra]|nr:hypothetical protein [Catenulispora rubra]
MRTLHSGCGGELNVAGTCDTCGKTVGREDEAWLLPWLSQEPVRLAMPTG